MTVGYGSRRKQKRQPATRPSPARPRILSHVRDREIAAAWANYLAAARTAAGLSKTELARAAQVGRATVFRWEAGESRPEQSEIVVRVAKVLGVDLDEALAAAGLRPTAQPPTKPVKEPPLDPDLLLLASRLADPNVSVAEKATIRATIQYLANLPEEPPGRRRREAS